jgi:hypothetical protein
MNSLIVLNKMDHHYLRSNFTKLFVVCRCFYSVLDKDHPAVRYKKNHQHRKDKDNNRNCAPKEHCGVIISHGANQVNATRDATRHAEIVAIDRLLTDGVSSDQLRLSPGAYQGGTIDASSNKQSNHYLLEAERKQWEDRWINDPSNPGHWTNSFGWRNNFDNNSLDIDDEDEFKVITSNLRSKDIFRHCQLYVTCEVSKVIVF